MADFFYMGGYGFYIWSSFGMTLIVLLAEVAVVTRHFNALRQRLSRARVFE